MSRNAHGHFAPGNDIGAETRIKGGTTLNPGGQRKVKRELILMAREHCPKALERARQILNDDTQEWRAWMDAAKFVMSYGIGSPPKMAEEDAEKASNDPVDQLTVAELQALARQSLADEQPESDGASDDDSDEVEH